MSAAAVPGLRSRSPVMTLGPVFVTAEPPSTATLFVVPSGGATTWAHASWNGAAIKSAVSTTSGASLATKLLMGFMELSPLLVRTLPPNDGRPKGAQPLAR